jgi:hypothetical protein
MQDFSAASPEIVNSMKASLSPARFGRYLATCGNDEDYAMRLYQWNSLVSQSLYIYSQAWEVCLRNKLNNFLCWKYNEAWPYDSGRAVRNLKGDAQRRLRETIERQERDREYSPVATNIIVADLSVGFWVSLLTKGYDIPYGWRNNLTRIFPNDKGLDRIGAWKICEDASNLRNRIAHHEPIYHLPLNEYYAGLQRAVAAMCAGTYAFAEMHSTFPAVLASRPTK